MHRQDYRLSRHAASNMATDLTIPMALIGLGVGVALIARRGSRAA